MSISLSQTVRTRCPQCQARFKIEVWIIVDKAERPDLWARCQNGVIHIFSCPHGHTDVGPAPILLRDAIQKRVYFASNQRTSKEQNERTARQLIKYLQRSLSPTMREDYLAHVEFILYENIPWVLSGNLVPYYSTPSGTRPENGKITGLLQEIALLTNISEMAHRCRLCRDLLSMVKQDDDPELWAEIQNELGKSFLQNRQDDRAENLERAIAAFESALTVFTRAILPFHWARAQISLGITYTERIRGKPADNLEHAISLIESALTVCTQDAVPHYWAVIHLNLGNAYRVRVHGQHAENIERAIEALQAALIVITHDTNPIDWAKVQIALGLAYSDRIHGQRAENIDRAIAAFQAALIVFSADTDPYLAAATQTDLGTAYQDRIRGERAENIERAIEAYKAALTVVSQDRNRIDWGRLCNYLGIAYSDRIRGERAENVEQAIELLELALTVYSRDALSGYWAMTQTNLGNAYQDRIRGERAENIERAIEAYQSALTVVSQDRNRIDWAATKNNLGNAYQARVRGDLAENKERAIEAFQSALIVRTREDLPYFWAETQTNLGVAYFHRIHGENSENLERAILAFQAALEVCTPDQLPMEARRAARGVAHVQSLRTRWDEAYTALVTAIQAADNVYSATLTSEGKTAEIAENARLYGAIVDTCLRLQPSHDIEAFQFAEEGRSRLLRDQLGVLHLPPPNRVPATLIAQERSLLQSTRNQENAIREAKSEVKRRQWVEEAVATRAKLNILWDELIRDYNAAEYVALRKSEKIEWADVQQWLSTQPRRVVFLEFFALEDRLVAFIVRKGDIKPLVVQFELSPRRLDDCVERFFREVHEFDSSQSLPETWRGIASLLLKPIMPHIANAELVYIVPHDTLHYLPLHALEYDHKPFIEYFPVAYTPSIMVTMRAITTLPSLRPHKWWSWGGESLVIGNATEDLPFAEEEAKNIARRFGVHPLLRAQANKSTVVSKLSTKNRAHIATHAYFNPDDPIESGILLANRDVLTAREVMTYRLETRLVVLSACQTAMQGLSAGDELVGLARAFLYAGVPSLVLSQWAVNDESTSKLMLNFYDRLFDNKGATKITTADALRLAILETRKDYPHTYHWAPFILYGDWR